MKETINVPRLNQIFRPLTADEAINMDLRMYDTMSKEAYKEVVRLTLDLEEHQKSPANHEKCIECRVIKAMIAVARNDWGR